MLALDFPHESYEHFSYDWSLIPYGTYDTRCDSNISQIARTEFLFMHIYVLLVTYLSLIRKDIASTMFAEKSKNFLLLTFDFMLFSAFSILKCLF